jgi:diguanylate cyclase (GGDEF)-like protein/PAS domain S-box-containing protein
LIKVTNASNSVQKQNEQNCDVQLERANDDLALKNVALQSAKDELKLANKKLAIQNAEKEKRLAELVIANRELAFQNAEKEKRASELAIANQELAFQSAEKGKRAAELVIANQELAFQNAEKEKRAAELVIANQELAFQSAEKGKRAAELVIANQELAFQNAEKEKRAAELVIANQELSIAAAAFESQDGMLITDANNIIIRVNNAFTNITGYTSQEAIGQIPRLLSSGHYYTDFHTSMWKSVKEFGFCEGEIWNKRKNGEAYLEQINISAVKDIDGKITNYVTTLKDITLSKIAADEIETLAFYDPLTRLPNRRLFLDRLKQASISHLRSGKAGGLLFLDLDNFKTINDTLGHNAGDLLLQQVAARLQGCVREGDTVARLGGDEFVLLLKNLSEHKIEAATQIKLIGENILNTVGKIYQLETQSYQIGCSLGATLLDDNELTTEKQIQQADIAMHQSKKAGGNTLSFFHPEMQEAINSRVLIENALKNAIKRKQFQLYYQIQVDSAYRPKGAEALIRWAHPERGLVPPMEFLPLAEENGQILPIGHWVLKEACAQLKIWEQNHLTSNLTLSVNVSARQFHQADFVDQVQTVVKHYGINPKRLKLELTESILLKNIEDVVESMNVLNEIGVRFSLDDFGTSYSSLQYLKKLPLAELKIDQSFVRDIELDSSDQVIVRTIIAMAHNLELNVIAEGVETEGQRELLINSGCNAFQGYLFGKPVLLSEFESLLQN